MNLVMTGSGRFVEVQATAEQVAFDDKQLAELLRVARQGITELMVLQKSAMDAAR
jgi:ribonuclease PH